MKVLKDIVLGAALVSTHAQLPYQLTESNLIMQYSIIDEVGRAIHRRIHLDTAEKKQIRCIAEYDIIAEQRTTKTIMQYTNPRYFCDEIPK